MAVKIWMRMPLWRRRGWRWERVRALPGYYPPDFLRIRRAGWAERELWLIEAADIPLHGADSLKEALEALIASCKRPKGEGSLFKLEPGVGLREVEGIDPFPEDALWNRGLFLKRMKRPPDKWLVALELARPVSGIFVSRWERYLAPWRVALEALLYATL